MKMLRQVGRSSDICLRSNTQRDVFGRGSRVARAQGNVWPSHSRHIVQRPWTSRQDFPSCCTHSAPLSAATSASASTVPHAGIESPNLSAAAATSAPTTCCHGPPGLSPLAITSEGHCANSVNPPAAHPNGPLSHQACPEPAAAVLSEATVATIPSHFTALTPSAETSASSNLQGASNTTVETSEAPPSASVSMPGPSAPAMANDEAESARIPMDSVAEARTGTGTGTGAGTEASSSGSRTSWPGRRNSGARSGGGGTRTGRWPPSPSSYPSSTRRMMPLYSDALTSTYVWPRPKDFHVRPTFLEQYPVPTGKTFNVNSFLGKKDPHRGKYLVPERRYRDFLASYADALEEGYQMYLTENYHQQVFKYFLEFDWDWDTDLALVMEVTPQLITLATQIASDFYGVPYANVITSIRTPYKIHLNFPQLITTELLACLCRDRLLEACVERLGQRYGSSVDWERLIDFPHGSLRLMGSRKATHMDSDPAWVLDKAYYPARLTEEGRWRSGRITPELLAAASIFPRQQQVAAFERSPAYLDMIYSDLEAYQKKMEERRLERARRRADREQHQHQQEQQQQMEEGSGSREPPVPNLPPGSSRNPLHVRLEVQPDETVALKVYVKSKYRHKNQKNFYYSRGRSTAAERAAMDGAAIAKATP